MYLKVKIIPSSKMEKIEFLKKDELRIWVKEPAENNHANNRILEIIKKLHPNTSIRIISGHHSPSKIVSIG